MSDATSLLTPKQNQVLQLLMKNMSNVEIASSLGVTEATAKAHVSAILERLACKSRRDAVRLCRSEDDSTRADG